MAYRPARHRLRPFLGAAEGKARTSTLEALEPTPRRLLWPARRSRADAPQPVASSALDRRPAWRCLLRPRSLPSTGARANLRGALTAYHACERGAVHLPRKARLSSICQMRSPPSSLRPAQRGAPAMHDSVNPYRSDAPAATRSLSPLPRLRSAQRGAPATQGMSHISINQTLLRRRAHTYYAHAKDIAAHLPRKAGLISINNCP